MYVEPRRFRDPRALARCAKARKVELTTHTIKGGGATIAHWYRTQAYNAHIPNNQVYLLPKKPLATNTTYTVHVIGEVSGTDFSRTWSFKTGAI
jgi:hypothetical protein